MKVVLLKEVANVGRAGDVKDVADGFAVNFLIPNKLAEAGTKSAIARAEILRKVNETERQIHKDLLDKNIASADGLTISLSEKANEKGHLFSGVHREEIVKAVKKQSNIDLPAESVKLEHPIKSIGEFSIDIEADGKKAVLKLVISPELPS